MGLLIFVAIAVFLAYIPLGVNVQFSDNVLTAQLVCGILKLRVYPIPERFKRKKDKPKAKPEKKEAPKPAEVPKKKTDFDLESFMPLIRLGIDFLNTFRKKLRINRLDLKVIMAGEDPCDLAVNYGRAWSVAGNLIASLERVFVIKKRNVEAECDFTSDKTVISARVKLTITLGRLLAMVVVYGIRAIREYLTFKKKREKAVQAQ